MGVKFKSNETKNIYIYSYKKYILYIPLFFFFQLLRAMLLLGKNVALTFPRRATFDG